MKQQDTLLCLFLSAMYHCYPNAQVTHEGSFSSGMYFAIKNEKVNEEMIQKVKQTIDNYITSDYEIHSLLMNKEDFMMQLQKQNQERSIELLKQHEQNQYLIHELDGYYGYYLDPIHLKASFVKEYYMYEYQNGIWLSTKNDLQDQPKLFDTFIKGQKWGELVQVAYVDQLNTCVEQNKLDELVLMSESLYEINIHEIAKDIVLNHQEAKFILIAGPSSAGKTTTSKRLCNHLKLLGKKPMTIEMDAFYKTNDMIPVMENGQRDFESFDAFDDRLFNETLIKLLNQEPVHMPKYVFGKGVRYFEEKSLVLEEDQVLIIEGIHGLNPKATIQIEESKKYKIYINALTHINLNEHERIKTNEIRLMRRMHRDMLFRNTPLEGTLQMWDLVRKGERENIFPYQEEANMILNTSLCYELPIIKKYLQPHLDKVEVEDERLQRIKKILSFVKECDSQALPRHSILSEFIGNSIF